MSQPEANFQRSHKASDMTKIQESYLSTEQNVGGTTENISQQAAAWEG